MTTSNAPSLRSKAFSKAVYPVLEDDYAEARLAFKVAALLFFTAPVLAPVGYMMGHQAGVLNGLLYAAAPLLFFGALGTVFELHGRREVRAVSERVTQRYYNGGHCF